MFDDIRASFERMLDQAGIEIPEQGFLAGPVNPIASLFGGKRRFDPGIGWDNAHFPLNYALLMKEGIPGIIERASAPAAGLTAEAQAYRQLIADCYRMIAMYIRRHGQKALSMATENVEDAPRLKRISQNCIALAERAPETFEEGLQLFWFIWRMRRLYTSSIGRFDVHLYPLYQRDVPSRISREEACQMLMELFGKLTAVFSGDTLMNLMVGGTDAQGNDSTNDLSLLIIEASIRSPGSEPHINIRLHDRSPQSLREAAARMINDCRGQGVLYFDRNIIPDLVRRGIPLEHARLYANDGCTELTFDQHSAIWFTQMESMKTLELALFRGQENPSAPHCEYHKWAAFQDARLFESKLVFGYDSGDPCACADYPAFYKLFCRQFCFQIQKMLEGISGMIRGNECDSTLITSPIAAGMVEASLDTGIDPMRGGWDVRNYQLLSGSLPTTADCLYAVKAAVYDEKRCSMAELLQALRDDFRGHEELQAYLKGLPKFGNDIDAVDEIAAGLVRLFCDCVENYPDPLGVRILPGIYNIDFNMFASALGATPDGRNGGDIICEHYSPTPGCARNGPTAVIASASKAPLHRGCASSPLYLALPRAMGALDQSVLLTLIDACEQSGLPIVSLSVYNKSLLEDAKIHPEKHEDLIVRVWGFNARFIDLDENLQNHIIARIL